ncbi:sensor histidine kinase KdpD [uncultured Psychroserpens sp.]|uniref:sensor histidine kinase n=1 Tax=uncultured Psychroserpens sp. TaxID=255436 RepID=UPI002637D5B0|nr:HAMP domain-containing sensor histidine kinase [uncultured Psychroserpens sp.]
MNNSKYRYILYIIVIVILSTIGIQAYWNYKNYESHKQQLINDVQISLDKAVDDYYTALATRTTLGIFLEGDQQKNAFSENSELQHFLSQIEEDSKEFTNLDSLDIEAIDGVTVVRGFKADSIIQKDASGEKPISPKEFKERIHKIKSSKDGDSASFDIPDIKMLTSKIVISIKNDSLDLREVDSLLKIELARKNILVNFYLDYKTSEHHIQHDQNGSRIIEIDKNNRDTNYLKTNSKSSFLPSETLLTIFFTNTTKSILYRMLSGILISTFLVLAIVSSLFYLLKIIKHQKQLAEVKNDLISNITHEFKTPIATIGVALESIQNFNVIDDKEKTKTYLDMSNAQLNKLNTMVEKLLETATLDSENLELKKDTYNISEVVSAVIEKHKLQNNNKTITSSIADNVLGNIDVFHFENAINNIIDNALKYGGNKIEIALTKMPSHIEISISDNGNTLTKVNKDRIFEKFYRVPKGNTHDVKGFGIGLYYTKKIIEKHNGNIALDLNTNHTRFKISLPDV